MKDVFAVIRDVQRCGQDQPVGLETAASIVSALNKEGYVIVDAKLVIDGGKEPA